MKTANDLFLSEETQDQKARRSVVEIFAEDDADLKRLAELSEKTINYIRLSRLKSTCAWLMLHKKITGGALSMTAATIVVAFFAPMLRPGEINTQETAKTEQKLTISEPVTHDKAVPKIKFPEAAKTDVEQPHVDKTLETYAQMSDPEKARILSGTLDLRPTPTLSPLSEVQINETLDKETQKISVEPTTNISTITVPVNHVNIHEEPNPEFEDEKSASDFIDQFGFGTEPKSDEVPEAKDDEVIGGVIPIPVAKPEANPQQSAQEIKDVRYQIVDRTGEKAGFRRMKDKNPDTTQWFLIIEAIDGGGKAMPMPVMNMDTGDVKTVTKWAVQVSEKDFMKFSDEKKKTGKIADTIIGTAPNNQTEPKWTVNLTGNMLTEWE